MGIPPNFESSKNPMPLDSFESDTTSFSQEISQNSYRLICEYVKDKIGISLGDNKQKMVATRLSKRLKKYNIDNYDDYFSKTVSGKLLGEEQELIDMLTTNETYLFREMAHFNFLRDNILPHWNTTKPFHCWSAACSTGEEAYSLAMTIDNTLPSRNWKVVASDISQRTLNIAKAGKISMQRIHSIPKSYLMAYCKKGINEAAGTLKINKQIRDKINFTSINLSQTLSEDLEMFDVIFLRNVLIYFDKPMRDKIVNEIITHLNDGGYLFISHTENISNFSSSLQMVQPSVYRKI